MRMQAHVSLDPGRVPLLDGVQDCLSHGVRSSLHAQNERGVMAVVDGEVALQHAMWPLLVDPQTGAASPLLVCTSGILHA